MRCLVKSIGIRWVFLLYMAAYGLTKRIEADLLRMIDGTFAPTKVESTITFNNGTATLVFSGDAASGKIEALYILFADASRAITQIQLDKTGSSKISTFSPPHVSVDSSNGAVTFTPNDRERWNGQAIIRLPSDRINVVKYAMAAKLPGDAGSCSSYMCTYSLTNAAISIPDLQIPELYDDI